jgi:hypothetical protein
MLWKLAFIAVSLGIIACMGAFFWIGAQALAVG